MRTLLSIAVAAAAAHAQDTTSIRACDQPATTKIDAAFIGQISAIPAQDSAKVGPAYLDNALEAIRESLRPGPLALNAYLVWPNRALLAADMTAVFTVTRDGHVRDIGLAASSLSSAFDHMILDAIQTADTSGLIPPLPSHAPSRVTFTLSVFTLPVSASSVQIRRPGHAQALLVTALPGWTGAVTIAMPHPVSPPNYPERARRAYERDSVEFRGVIDESGHFVPASAFVAGGRYLDFATSVREWMPTATYEPARIGTCAVKSIVRLPFVFSFTR